MRFKKILSGHCGIGSWGSCFLGAGIVPHACCGARRIDAQGENQGSSCLSDLARRMSIRGTVKMIVVVPPNGNLKDTKVVGGNPLLVNAAMDALKKWKFEPAQD